MTPPTQRQIQKRLSLLVEGAVSFDGIVFRSSTPKYANTSDVISGTGSKLHGQRWNPAGIAVVYASLTPETAMACGEFRDRDTCMQICMRICLTLACVDPILQL